VVSAPKLLLTVGRTLPLDFGQGRLCPPPLTLILIVSFNLALRTATPKNLLNAMYQATMKSGEYRLIGFSWVWYPPPHPPIY